MAWPAALLALALFAPGARYEPRGALEAGRIERALCRLRQQRSPSITTQRPQLRSWRAATIARRAIFFGNVISALHVPLRTAWGEWIHVAGASK